MYGRAAWTDFGWYDSSGVTVCGLGGVRICVLDTETCTESDEAGQFVLSDVPSDADVEISFEKAGFYSALRLAHVLDAPVYLSTTRMLKESERRALLESVDLSLKPTMGGLVAIAVEPGEAVGSIAFPEGVQITLLPGEVKPYYSLGTVEPGGLSSDELDLTLESTRMGGWALFPSLEPGDYTVRFERDGAPCSVLLPGFGFGVDGQGHVRARVREGFDTAGIAVLCQ